MAADLVDQGVSVDSIVIRPVGTFTRKYRKDILHYETNDTNFGTIEELLFIDVTREGIFDSLPQGLFYQPDSKKSNSGLENRLEELKMQRKEESEARKFFSVLEKEFNQCKVLVELEERKSIFGLSEKFNSELFTDIWPELKDVALKFHKYLFQILPIAYKCRGNVQLSATLLGFVLNEKVSIEVNSEPVIKPNPFPANQLNQRYLGTDFVLGSHTPSYDLDYKINIGPIERGSLTGYMLGGEYEKVIGFLADYFIPYDANYELNIILEKGSEKLFLQDSETHCFLGFDSKI